MTLNIISTILVALIATLLGEGAKVDLKGWATIEIMAAVIVWGIWK